MPSTVYYYFSQWVKAGVFEQLWVGALAAACIEFPFLDAAAAFGMTNSATVEKIRDAFRDWKESPDAFFAWS